MTHLGHTEEVSVTTPGVISEIFAKVKIYKENGTF